MPASTGPVRSKFPFSRRRSEIDQDECGPARIPEVFASVARPPCRRSPSPRRDVLPPLRRRCAAASTSAPRRPADGDRTHHLVLDDDVAIAGGRGIDCPDRVPSFDLGRCWSAVCGDVRSCPGFFSEGEALASCLISGEYSRIGLLERRGPMAGRRRPHGTHDARCRAPRLYPAAAIRRRSICHARAAASPSLSAEYSFPALSVA